MAIYDFYRKEQKDRAKDVDSEFKEYKYHAGHSVWKHMTGWWHTMAHSCVRPVSALLRHRCS